MSELMNAIKSDKRVLEVALWGSTARGEEDPTDIDISIGYDRRLVTLFDAKLLSNKYDGDRVFYSGIWRYVDSGWHLVPHSRAEGDFPDEFKVLWSRR